MKWLRWLLGGCAHPGLYRERRDGVLHLVCPDCRYAAPLLTWTAAERAKRRRLEARRHRPATVVPYPRRHRA